MGERKPRILIVLFITAVLVGLSVVMLMIDRPKSTINIDLKMVAALGWQVHHCPQDTDFPDDPLLYYRTVSPNLLATVDYVFYNPDWDLQEGRSIYLENGMKCYWYKREGPESVECGWYWFVGELQTIRVLLTNESILVRCEIQKAGTRKYLDDTTGVVTPKPKQASDTEWTSAIIAMKPYVRDVLKMYPPAK